MATPHQSVTKEPGIRPGTFYFHAHDGFYYHHYATTSTRHYYKCVRYEAAGCRGRATSGADGFTCHTSHNHEADPWYPQEIALRNMILRSCEHPEARPFQEIINEHSEVFPVEVRVRVTLDKMRDSMRRTRQKMFPAYLE